MRVRRSLNIATATLVAAGALLATNSQAAEGKTFYLSAQGCGTTQEPGRLEPKKIVDDSPGCGTIGGIPIQEVIHQVDGGSVLDTFDTGTAGLPLTLGSGKITGTMSARFWKAASDQPDTGGVGTVTFDVALVGTTASGTSVDFGSVTVNGSAAPGQAVVDVPFELAIPDSGAGKTFKKFTLSMIQRGANLGMSARNFDGASFVVFPQK